MGQNSSNLTTVELTGTDQRCCRHLHEADAEELIGQAEVMEKLMRKFNSTQHHPFVLTGSAGMGKSTIARSFVKRLEKENKISRCIWVCLGFSEEMDNASVKKVATGLKIRTRETTCIPCVTYPRTIEDILMSICEEVALHNTNQEVPLIVIVEYLGCLYRDDQFFLILHSYPNIFSLFLTQEYSPTASGTSFTEVEGHSITELRPLTEQEAEELLKRSLTGNKISDGVIATCTGIINEICTTLKGHPGALQLVAHMVLDSSDVPAELYKLLQMLNRRIIHESDISQVLEAVLDVLIKSTNETLPPEIYVACYLELVQTWKLLNLAHCLA